MIGVLHRDCVRAARPFGGAGLLLVLVAALAMAFAAPAHANPRYAAIVVDANNGNVLFARNADAQRYPASITKVMTLYVLFEELDAGRLRLDSPLRVSALAAAQPPSKVGVRAGTTISVRDAIGVLVTRSANDVAVVVAENVSGSVEAFAQRMNRTARSIGMHSTTFRNPHGLPDARQITTARDIVALATGIRARFPQYYGFFNTRSYSYAGTAYRNHNRLVGQVAGVDGLKTGFIRASGFNLVATQQRDGRYLVAVVMGGRTAASRDAHVREILANAYPRASRGAAAPLMANVPLPRPRPHMESTGLADARRIMVPSTVVPGTMVGIGRAPVTASMGLAAPAPAQEPDPATAEYGSADDTGATPPTGSWIIQVGAYASRDLARATLDRAIGFAPDMLSDASPFTESVDRNGSTLWRARFAGFDRGSAEAACLALKRRDFGCFPARQ